MNSSRSDYDEVIEKFLEDFISIIYKGHDHIVARNYYRDLFRKLIPEYFCICKDEQTKADHQ